MRACAHILLHCAYALPMIKSVGHTCIHVKCCGPYQGYGTGDETVEGVGRNPSLWPWVDIRVGVSRLLTTFTPDRSHKLSHQQKIILARWSQIHPKLECRQRWQEWELTVCRWIWSDIRYQKPSDEVPAIAVKCIAIVLRTYHKVCHADQIQRKCQ